MAFAHLAGGGTNNNKVAATSIHLTNTGGTLAAGSIAFAVLALDNTGTGADGDYSQVTSVTDNAGNSWSKVAEFTNTQAAPASGATISLWKSKLAFALTTTPGSNDVALNFGSVAAQAGVLGGFSVTSGNDVRTVGTIQKAATDAAALPTQTISGLTSKEYLFIRVSAWEGPATSPAAGTNYAPLSTSLAVGTSGGATATNMTVLAAYRILTGTGDSNNASTTLTPDSASMFVAFEEFSPSPQAAPADMAVATSWSSPTQTAHSPVTPADMAVATSWSSPTETAHSPVAPADLAVATSWSSPSVGAHDPAAQAAPADMAAATAWGAATATAHSPVAAADLLVADSWSAPGVTGHSPVGPADLAVATALSAPSTVMHSPVAPADLLVADRWSSPSVTGPVGAGVEANRISIGPAISTA